MENSMFKSGFIEVPEDPRDFHPEDIAYSSSPIPREYEGIEPTIRDQGQSGMCVAFAAAAMKEVHELKERGERIIFSPAFIYGLRDQPDNPLRFSEGMSYPMALGQLRKWGVCEARDFDMIGTTREIHDLLIPKLPSLAPRAVPNVIQAYLTIPRNDHVAIQRAILDDGCVMLGMDLDEGFMRHDKTGVITPNNSKNYGGHGMLVVGWRIIHNQLHWKTANTWGPHRGDRGFVYIPANHPSRLQFFGATDMPLNLNEGTTIEMAVGNDVAKVTKKGVTVNMKLDIAPQVVSGRTVVPLRFIAESLDKDVTYIPNGQRIIIKNK